MEIGPVSSVLLGFVVRPHQEKSASGDDVLAVAGYTIVIVGAAAGAVGQVEAPEVHSRWARVIEFEPIFKLAVGGVGKSRVGGVTGQPFVDKDVDEARGIGAARRR